MYPCMFIFQKLMSTVIRCLSVHSKLSNPRRNIKAFYRAFDFSHSQLAKLHVRQMKIMNHPLKMYDCVVIFQCLGHFHFKFKNLTPQSHDLRANLRHALVVFQNANDCHLLFVSAFEMMYSLKNVINHIFFIVKIFNF